MATDGGGNVYVADEMSHTIRMINPEGMVTTLAGLAESRGVADGTGATARFAAPAGVAIDSSGNLYVADRDNHTIRKITPAGVVTTLAGSPLASGSIDGAGNSARFNRPAGVTADGLGNVYVADRDNHTVRKITPLGVVTTLAGSPGAAGSVDGTGAVARFDHPEGVATDSAGNVYVADSANNTIRKITPAGAVTTFAGLPDASGGADGTGSAARFRAPTSVATDGAGNVYVADTTNHMIRKITPAGEVSTLAGLERSGGSVDGIGSAARFLLPEGVAADVLGNVYVADTRNSTIRAIGAAGVVTTLAGSVAGVSGDVDGTASVARFNAPAGVAARAGNVFVADTFNHTIRKINAEGVVSTLAGSAGLSGSADGTGSAARFNGPKGVATDGSGNLYVSDTLNHTIRKVTPEGAVTTLAGSAGLRGNVDGAGSVARFYQPTGITTDSAGNVYVVDIYSTLRRITPAGVVTTLAGSAPGGNNIDGTGSAAQFSAPQGLAADIAGNLYVADGNNRTLRKVTPAGVVTTLAGVPGLAGGVDGTGSGATFRFPMGAATDSVGNIYMVDEGTTVRMITPERVVTTLAGSFLTSGDVDGAGSSARFAGAYGVATDSAGSIYVADTDNNKIRVGRLALADAATIDFATGTVGFIRQLGTSAQTATSWQWRIVRQPSGSRRVLSSDSIPNPTFIPDVADLFVFQLTASDGEKTSITTVSLSVTEAPVIVPGRRRRAVGHHSSRRGEPEFPYGFGTRNRPRG